MSPCIHNSIWLHVYIKILYMSPCIHTNICLHIYIKILYMSPCIHINIWSGDQLTAFLSCKLEQDNNNSCLYLSCWSCCYQWSDIITGAGALPLLYDCYYCCYYQCCCCRFRSSSFTGAVAADRSSSSVSLNPNTWHHSGIGTPRAIRIRENILIFLRYTFIIFVGATI
jgi:hypothetical protein